MKKVLFAFVALMGLMCNQALAQQCDTVRVFPWNNDFYTNFGCWEQLGDSSSMWQLNTGDSYSFVNSAYITAPYDSAANGCVLVSPALALPADTANMLLSFRTRRVGTSAQLRVLVSTGLRENLAGYDTLLSVTPSGLNNYEVNLSAYAGQTVYVAFSIVKPNQSYNLTFFGVGSVNIISDRMPQGEWLIQNMAARTGDTVEHEFYLTQGIEDDSNTVFTWHSTMVEAGQATLVEMVSDMLIFYDYSAVRTLPRSIYRVIYHTPGIDTVTVTASNVYGTITSQSVSHIYDCAPIASFPWAMERGDLGVCWSTDYSISSSASYGYRDEDGEMYYTDWYLQSPTYTENYVVTNAIAVPTDAAHLALILRWSYGNVEVRAALAGQGTDMMDFVADTTLFTDLLFNEAGSNVIKTRKVSLAAYAGDTIRLAIIHKSSNVLNVMPLNIDYDTLPKIAAVQVPSMATVGEAALCTSSLRYGATDGLHYSWSSARGGVFVTNTLGDSAWVTYPSGVGDKDTIRVVVANAYGADTVVRTLRILDCTPQQVLPWKETFAYGTTCWYKAEGCKFYDAIPYNYSANEYQRHLYLNTQTDTLGSWIMSKAIMIPADTSLLVTLFWKVASSNTTYHHLYSMLATTSDDYTDTVNYTLLYTDSSTHVNFSNYDTRSVSLAQYAGQTIHIAIHNHGNHMASSGIGLYLDDIEVRTTTQPVVSLSVPSTVNSHEPITYTATLTEGSPNGMTVTWHSSLMDTTWVDSTLNSQFSTFNLIYALGGRDTITVTASNIYGSRTATAIVTVNDCTPIATLPYEETFNSVTYATYNHSSGGYVPTCWNRYWAGSTNYKPHVINTYLNQTAIHTYVQSDRALALMAGVDAGFDSVATVEGPLFEAPLNGQLLSFYYMHENANRGVLSVGYLQDGAFVEVASMEPQATGRIDTVNLNAFPADMHRFALQWKYNTTSWYGVIVDDIRVFAPDSMPSVRLTAPATASVGDSILFMANLANGLPDSLTYTWHSTLLNQWAETNGQWSVVYTAEGTDTITVIATNAYGSDTAWAVIPVRPNVEVMKITSPSLSSHTEVPICGMYADYGFLAEFIYPAKLLTWIEGSVIRGVRFHTNNPSFVYNETFTLSMQVVADSTCTAAAWRHDSTALQVWTGSITIEDSLWTVWFDTPFTYNGGHLLFRSATDGLTGGSYSGSGFQCFITSDTAGRYQFANPQHELQESFYTTPYLPAIDFLYNLDSSFCHRPEHLTADSVWGTGATLSWDSMHSAIGYQWTLTNEGQMVDSGITTATTVSVTGLTTFNTYTFGVSTLCGSGDVSGATTVTFTAQNPLICDGTTPPYRETFESTTSAAYSMAGYLPDCWESSNSGSSPAYAPHVIAAGDYSFISNIPGHALFMVAGTPSPMGTTATVLLPRFDAELSRLALGIDHRHENADQGVLAVGYYDEALDTFYPIDTLTPQTASYLRDTVYFSAAAPMGARIALRWTCSNSYHGVAIDNIEVFISNGIPAPEMLTVENVTATCATLRWSEVDTATAYRVALDGAMHLDTVLTDTTLTLCNLMDDADYNVMVVPMVGSDAGRRISATFHTPMLCAPLANVSISPEGIISWQYDTIAAEQTPVGVEIEIIDHQGMVLVHTDSAYFSPYVPANLTPGHTYSFAVRTLCTNSTANTADTVVMQVAPSVCAEAGSNTIPSNSHFMDNFWESNYSQVVYPASFASVDTIYGIALRVAQYEPYSWQTTSGTCRYDIYVGQTNGTLSSPLTADSLIKVVNDRQYSFSGTGWKDFVFDTPYIYDGTSNLVVTIVGRQSSTVYNPVYGVHNDATCTHFVQDADHGSGSINPSTFNFQWEINTNIPDIRLLGGCGGSVNTCLAPEVEVTAVDTHSVSLQWAQRGSESLWQVEYHTVGTNTWQLADTTSVTNYTITGLAQATHYVVRVGAVCSDSLIAYGFPDSATTLCGYMELPYTISFLADEYPCWTLGSNVSHSNWNGVTLSEWNTNGYLISPEVNANIANLRATITSIRPVAESYESRFSVGVGNADGSNVTWIDTIGFLQQYTMQTDEVHFNHYTGSGHYIILKGVEGTCNIHQFTLEPFAGCVPVHDVTVDNIGEHSAQLTWVPEVTTNTWAVYLDDALVATTATPSYTLSGLNSNTQYTVVVREICGAGDTSTAVTRMFQTLCDAFALPYFEEFDQAPLIGSERILTDCWVFHKTGNYATAYCTGDQWTYTCLSFDDSNEGYDVINYLSSPRLTVGSGGALVAFKGQTSYFDTFTVGIMINPYDTSTFIPVRDITVSAGGMAWYSFSTDTIAGAPTNSTFTVAFRFNGEHGSGLIDSLTVTAINAPAYTVTLAVNDTTMGSVTGAGVYDIGSTVIITATPNEGYSFVTWSDSVTAPTREFRVTSDISLIAYFAPSSEGIDGTEGSAHTVTIHPNPATDDAYISVSMPSTVTVVDLHGRTVTTPSLVDGTLCIKHGTLPKGIYFVSVSNSAGTTVKKLVIQ